MSRVPGLKTMSAAALIGLTLSGLFAGRVDPAWATRSHAAVTLNLVAYSTPQDAYSLIIPAFARTKAGKGVSVQASYGASGDQSRKVSQGLPADIVAFSLAPDISRLVAAHMVKSTWTKEPHHGMVTDSIVVFGVRKGNPKHIHTWADLTKKGIDVVTPNPFTSGGARWNIMAAYGSQIVQHKTPKQAVSYLAALFNNVSVQDDSARAELQTFLGGKGDVMLAYENEMIGAQQKGAKVDYVIPPQSILIENPAAVTTTTSHSAQANAFLKFLWTPTAQRIFGQKGYRPVVKTTLAKFHFKRPKTLFAITKVGGWAKVQKQFFDPNTGIMAGIERNKR